MKKDLRKLTHQEYYILYGIIFGYPDCCVMEFIETQRNKKTIEDRFDASDETGFVPCYDHAIMVLTGQIELGDLIEKRFHRHRFPRDSGFQGRETDRAWMRNNYYRYKDRIDKIISKAKSKKTCNKNRHRYHSQKEPCFWPSPSTKG